VGTIRVVNRSLDRGRALAERSGDGFAGLDQLSPEIAGADLVVSATGATEAVIDARVVRSALDGRRSAPLVLLDLAVPRDVAADVEALDGVRVIDIRAIRERLMARGDTTTEDIARAHEIVAEEVRRWVVRRRSDALAPLIRAVRARGDEAVRSELARYASRLSDLTAEQREAVEALARGVSAKLLHDPIVELKERSEPGADDLHAKLLIELLRLDPDDE
jgi:glutamyl-tRNA reductase